VLKEYPKQCDKDKMEHRTNETKRYNE